MTRSKNEEAAKAAMLDQLMHHPKLGEVAKAAELEGVKRRAALVQRLEAARRAVNPEEAQRAQAAVAAANRRIEEAREAVKTAEREQLVAIAAASQVSDRGRREAALFERELSESADPRIEQLSVALDDIWMGRVRHSIVVLPSAQRNHVSGQRDVTYLTNADKVYQASAAINEAVAECSQLKLAALTREEITARLKAICQRLEPMLRPLDVRLPTVGDFDVTYTLDRAAA